jgi:hypothetical protein
MPNLLDGISNVMDSLLAIRNNQFQTFPLTSIKHDGRLHGIGLMEFLLAGRECMT